MNDGEPEHDPEPEQPVTGRQKARAAVSQLHPPEMLAKLCNGLYRNCGECSGPLCSASCQAPGAQPDGILSDDLRVGMKQAADKISSSKFEIYAYSTRHDLSEAASDELLQMLKKCATAISCYASACVYLNVDP